MIFQNNKSTWAAGSNELDIVFDIVPANPQEHDQLESMVADGADFSSTASFLNGALHLAVIAKRKVTLEEKAALAKAAADKAAADKLAAEQAEASQSATDAEKQKELNMEAQAIARAMHNTTT